MEFNKKSNEILVINDCSSSGDEIEIIPTKSKVELDDTTTDKQSVSSTLVESEEKFNGSSVTSGTINPFQKFAHIPLEKDSSYQRKSDEHQYSLGSGNKNCSGRLVASYESKVKSRPRPKMEKKRKRIDSNEIENFAVKTEAELIECMRKWQSMAHGDAPLEVKRFQVLVAARLHAQSQEPIVKKSMLALHEFFNVQTGGVSQRFLSCDTLSKADPEVISKVIPSILFANVKSKQIVKAALEVKTTFNGIVPTSLHGLKSITGIGPQLAELLFYVNSPTAFAKIEKINKTS